MKQRDIRGFIATYHRNGVCGEGFYLCSFIFDKTDLRAVIFDEPGRVAVFSNNCVQRWRGDEFEPVLREALKLQESAQPERAHAQ